MTKDRNRLIGELVSELEPVRRPGRNGGALVLWLGLSIAYSLLIVFTTGPLREGALVNLVQEPLFAAESIVALVAIFSLAWTALRLAIPGTGRPSVQLLFPIASVCAWIGIYVAGFWFPAHPVSSAGYREHCASLVVIFSLPCMALLLLQCRRLFPLWPRTTASLCGAAAGALPAALMQFACMYDPGHILMFHLGPVLVSAAIGAAAGQIALAQRPRHPRRGSTTMH